MIRYTRWLRSCLSFACLLFTLVCDAGRFLLLCLRPSPALAAENLFLRKQLALYQERQTTPRACHQHDARRSGLALALVRLAAGLACRATGDFDPLAPPGVPALVALEIQAGTATDPGGPPSADLPHGPRPPDVGPGAHRQRTAAQAGPARVPTNRAQIFAEAPEPRSGHTRAVPALVHVCPQPRRAIVACDFCVAITATFRMLYVFVVIEHASRRLLHVNVTAHPTAEWTLQQLREAVPFDHGYRFLIHDRDAFSPKS